MRRTLVGSILLTAAGCTLPVEHDVPSVSTAPVARTSAAQTAATNGTYLWTRRAEEMLRRIDPALADQPNRQRVLLYGGWTTEGVLGDTWEWDGIGWVRRIPDRNPGPRMSAAMVYDERGQRTLLFGGISRTAPVMELAPTGLWEWNGSTWARVVTPNTPTARAGSSFSWDPTQHRGYLFAGGTGVDVNERGSFSIVSDELWTFDGRDWSQIPKAGAWPTPRTNPSTVWDPERSRLIMHGGFTSVGLVDGVVQSDPSSFVNDTWEFDGSSWTQWPAGTIPGELGSPSVVFDPATRSVRLAAEFPPYATDQGLVIYRQEGQSWVPGPQRGLIDVDYESSDPAGSPVQGSLLFSKSTWSSVNRSFLFVSGVRARSGSLAFGAPYEHDWLGNDTGFTRMDGTIQPPSLSSSGVATVGNRSYVFAGQGTEGEPARDDFYTWDGGRWGVVVRTAPWPPARRDPGMAALPDGRIVLFGGRVGSTRLSDTWVWQKRSDVPTVGTWTEVESAESPSGRYGMAMAAVDSVVGLFGGNGTGDTLLGDTWLFDGTAWRQQAPATAPSARRTPSATRAASGSMWMFGGGTDGPSGSVALADLWELRATGGTATWTQLDGAAPTRRRRAGMTTDPDTQRTLLYGGSGDDARSEIYDLTVRPAEPDNGIVREDNQDRPRRRYTAVMEPNASGGTFSFGGTSSDSDSRLGDTWQLRLLGVNCTDSSQCGVGLSCTEGVCCESAACGPCNTCAAPGSRGLCAPRGSYGAVPGCDGEGQACSVDGHCRLADQQRCAESEACASGTCLTGGQSAGVCCTAAGCAVRCVEGTNELQTPDGTRISCGAYACAADRCASTCNSLADCSEGAVCNEQKQCVTPRADGAAEDPGCGCRTASGAPLGKSGLGLALIALLARARRRRREA